MQQQWKEWKSNLQAFNLKVEFQLSNDLMIKKSPIEAVMDHGELNDLMKIYLNSGSPVNIVCLKMNFLLIINIIFIEIRRNF